MKTKISKQLPALTIIFMFIVSFSACTSIIAKYSPYMYQQSTSLKVEASTLMDKAVEPFSKHEAKVAQLMSKVEKAYEYAKGLPKNSISTKQWEILKSSEKNLLGGFMKRWKEENQLSAVFIKEAKGLVADAFDAIIGLETGKIKPKDIKK